MGFDARAQSAKSEAHDATSDDLGGTRSRGKALRPWARRWTYPPVWGDDTRDPSRLPWMSRRLTRREFGERDLPYRREMSDRASG